MIADGIRPHCSAANNPIRRQGEMLLRPAGLLYLSMWPQTAQIERALNGVLRAEAQIV